MRNALICSALLGAFGFVVVAAHADDAEKPKYSIKDVMGKAHKGELSLLKKVASGQGTEDDKKMLLELYESLAQHKPPKGDEDAWQVKAAAMVAVAKAVVAGEDGATDKLGATVNCGACHKDHKPS